MPSTNNLADYTATTDLKTIRAVGSCNSPHVIKFYAGLIDRVWINLFIFIYLFIYFIKIERKSSCYLYGSMWYINGKILYNNA
jgi:hypothetical protein